MADILKILNLVNTKSYDMPTKPLSQTDAVFNLSDLNKIVKTNDRAAEFRQDDKSFTGNNSASLLDMQLKITKNPTFAVSLLKGLIGEDILSQISQNGSPEMINEFNEFAKNIFLQGDAVSNDLISQQKGSTSFNGELFDFLRTIAGQTSSAELKNAIAGFLKNASAIMSQDEILKSLSASFKYLSQVLSPSKSLSEQLETIAKLLESNDAGINFQQIKADASKVMTSVSNSLIATDETKNMLSLIKYNFSRFNDNPFTLNESFKSLLSLIPNKDVQDILKVAYEKFIQGSNMPSLSKDALLSESTSFHDADKLTFAIADKANEQIKSMNLLVFKSDLASISQQVEKLLANSSNNASLSLSQGSKAISDILKLVLPQNASEDVSQLLKAFNETKDLNTLITRLSVIINSIENADVKTQLAKVMNAVLTGLSTSSEVIYKPPTSMENLVDFLAKSLNNPNISHLGIVDPNSLVQSMLTAPGVFTPLLHFILPVQIEDLRAFGELWIDNNAGENTTKTDDDSNHLFLSFDIENIGLFELEIFTKDTSLKVSLYCPKEMVKQFATIKDKIEAVASQSGYSISSTKIQPLTKVRNLVEVFPRIAERRAGLNVKV